MTITYTANPDGSVVETTTIPQSMRTRRLTAEQAAQLLTSKQAQVRESGADSLSAAVSQANTILAQQVQDAQSSDSQVDQPVNP